MPVAGMCNYCRKASQARGSSQVSSFKFFAKPHSLWGVASLRSEPSFKFDVMKKNRRKPTSPSQAVVEAFANDLAEASNATFRSFGWSKERVSVAMSRMDFAGLAKAVCSGASDNKVLRQKRKSDSQIDMMMAMPEYRVAEIYQQQMAVE